MESIRTLLVIEDNPGDARLLEVMFEEGEYNGELMHVESMADAEKHLAQNKVDIILLDLGLPDAQGLGAVERARRAAPGIPVVVLTGLEDEALATKTLKEGVQDYIVKGQYDTRGFMRTLRFAIERKRLERLKDEFVATVSHELRTPLTSVAASLGLILGKAVGVLPDPVGRLLTIAYNNIQRLVRLVNDILDIEKLESSLVVFDLRQVDVRQIVQQVMESNREFAADHDVRLRLEDFCLACDVRVDADRLTQVLTNLLSNAIKFSPPGGEVTTTISNTTGAVRVAVRDHGPGISADFRPHIFEKFAQADATNTRQKGGTGLGLSIAKQIVKKLGGEIGFENAPEGGTIFNVELPTWAVATNFESSASDLKMVSAGGLVSRRQMA